MPSNCPAAAGQARSGAATGAQARALAATIGPGVIYVSSMPITAVPPGAIKSSNRRSLAAR